MRWKFTLFILLLISNNAGAQKLTGIWRGYFSSSNGLYREGIKEENYKYEIQIDQQDNNSLKGVTYSYKTTVFYGKAEINGIYNARSKSLILKETHLMDIKIGDKSEPCLMTCYLDYTKIGKLEILEGTFISLNVKDKGDCGSGKVYLERVSESDFKKEDFLIKKKNEPAPKTSEAEKLKTPVGSSAKANTNNKPVPQKPTASGINTRPPSNAISSLPKKTVPAVKTPQNNNDPRVKPVVPAEKPLVVSKVPERAEEELVNQKKHEEKEMQQTEASSRRIDIPKVLLERENNLVKTITTSEENVEIDLWDNGTIDNDTISVYHNNKLVVSNGRLSDKPIIIRIKCSKTDNHHEIIVVAENLGEIPPNTAMMVINPQSGKKERHEIFLASTEQRNAKVIINYVPKE